MLRSIAIATVILMMGAASEAAPLTPDARAARAAAHKGYTGEKAKCYTEVSKRYYKLGTSTVPSRTTHAWHADLWNQCRISR
jgi:hypothetical protein